MWSRESVRRIAFLIAVACGLATKPAVSSNARQAARTAHALAVPFRYSRLPICTTNGDRMPERFQVAPRAIDVAWVDQHGAVTLRKNLSFGGDVQSAYVSSAQQLWLLVARPGLAYLLNATRHHAYVALNRMGPFTMERPRRSHHGRRADELYAAR